MPKATVNEESHTPLRKDYVGTAREIAPVKSKTIPERVQQATDRFFRAGVLAANALHRAPSIFRRQIVHA